MLGYEERPLTLLATGGGRRARPLRSNLRVPLTDAVPSCHNLLVAIRLNPKLQLPEGGTPVTNPRAPTKQSFGTVARVVDDPFSQIGCARGFEGVLNLDRGAVGLKEPVWDEWQSHRIDYTDPRPFDVVAFNALELRERTERLLEILVDVAKRVAPRMDWDPATIDEIAEEIREREFRMVVEIVRGAKSTKSRRYRARVFAILEYPQIALEVVLYDRDRKEFARKRWLPPAGIDLSAADQHCRSTRWWNGRFVIKGNAIHPPWIFDFTDVLPREDWS